MTDLKSLCEKVLKDAEKSIIDKYRSKASFAASEYVENGSWFSDQRVQKHEAFMSGALWSLENNSLTNSDERLAKAVLVLSETLEDIDSNYDCDKDYKNCRSCKSSEAIAKANEICREEK